MMTQDAEEPGSQTSAPEDATTTPYFAETAEPRRERRRWRPSLATVSIAAVLALVVVAVLGVWFYVSVTLPVPTPVVVSLTPAAAEKVLHQARLVSGRATYQITSQFPAGLIIAQSPLPYARVAQGSPVNITIADAPTTIAVPDVVGADSSYAASLLDYQRLKPVMLYAYSKDTRSGSVIEQLPRAGDTAVTGSVDVIVISLGPGAPGSAVPGMIGKSFAEASKVASAATLFAQPRMVIATGTPSGTVVDQAPTSGTVVPVGTTVWVSVAGQAPKP